MRKTYSQYITYIKYMLGAVSDNEDSLEYMTNDLTEIIKIAFSEIEPYINTRKRFTVPWIKNAGVSGGAIDFKKLGRKAKSVTSVRRGSSQGMIDTSFTTTAGTWYYGWYLPVGNKFSADFDPWAMQALMLKGINEVSGDKHFLFDYDSQCLYINFNTMYPKSVTIDYIPEYQDAEQLDDSYWINILQQYALALVKISLSHYRGKYKEVVGAPFSLNYEKLETEGKEERERIMTELVDSNLLNYRFD